MVNRNIDAEIILSLKKYIEKVKEIYKVDSVILFGSYAKKTATKYSDIDLLIDTNETLIGFKLYSLITQIEEKFKKDVDAFEKSEIIQNSKIENEIKNTGVVVYAK